VLLRCRKHFCHVAANLVLAPLSGVELVARGDEWEEARSSATSERCGSVWCADPVLVSPLVLILILML
jgi:hypothetical protein